MNNEYLAEWVDKYRPTSLKDYVLDADTKQYFKGMIKNKSLQNMTFISCPGSGKTSMAKVLCNEVNADVLFIKCATEGGIDTLRTKVEPFCNAMSMEGKLKVVILDELDSASSTSDSSFQKGLRTLIEASQDDCRFICTANYQKVIPAVLSRCPVIPLEFGKKDLLLHLKKILDTEKITYDKESLKAFVEESFKYYPDCRRIIKYLQMCSNEGMLKVKLNAIINNAKDDFMRELVEKTCTEKNILDVRTFYLRNKDKVGDFIDAGVNIFNYVVDNDIISNADGILVMTDLLYKLNVVVDKESMFFGILVAINKYKKVA